MFFGLPSFSPYSDRRRVPPAHRRQAERSWMAVRRKIPDGLARSPPALNRRGKAEPNRKVWLVEFTKPFASYAGPDRAE